MVANVITKASVIFLSFVAFSSARKFPDFADALAQLRFLKNNRSSLERAWSASYDRQWLPSVVSNITVLSQVSAGASVVEPQCLLDLYTWAVSLKRKESWAIQSQCLRNC